MFIKVISASLLLDFGSKFIFGESSPNKNLIASLCSCAKNMTLFKLFGKLIKTILFKPG